MRQLLLILLALPLAGCLGGGSSSPGISAVTIEAPIAPVTPPAEQPEDPADPSDPADETPSPVFDYASITAKSFTNAGGALTFTGSHVVDTKCGYSYAVQSTSQAGDVLTVTTKLLASSDYTAVSHMDCEIAPDFTSYRSNTASCLRFDMQPTARLIGFYVTYTIESVNGGLAVTRNLETYRYRALCDSGATAYHSTFKLMPEELYNE